MTLTDGTHTYAAERVALRVEIALGKLYADDAYLYQFTAASVDVTDAPSDAVERRQHAIARFGYKHSRTTHDVPAMIADVNAMRALGRTERWQTALDTWVRMIETDPYGDLDWVITQYAVYTNYAA